MKNFMMLFIAVFLSAATLLPLNGNEGKKKSFPACSFSTKLEMNFPADTAFLLLYLEESSYNMQETKARIDTKEKQFLEALKKEYPSVKYTSSTESIGGKNNDPYRDDTAFQPCIRKTFLLSFSPDETLAIKLSDLAIKNNLRLFCGVPAYFSNHSASAVIYGIKDDAKIISGMKKKVLQTLFHEAEELAENLKKGKVQLDNCALDIEMQNALLTFKNMKIKLPVLHFSAQKDSVPVTVKGSAQFSFTGK